MNESKNPVALIGIGITIGGVLVFLLLMFGAKVTGLNVGPVVLVFPTETIVPFPTPVVVVVTPTPLPYVPPTQVVQSVTRPPTTIPTAPAYLVPTTPARSGLLSLEILRQVLDETSAERVEPTIGRLRDFCNQGMVVCRDHPTNNWSVTGPAVVGTDLLHQPINGGRVIKVNKDAAGNWLPGWIIGLFYIPAGLNTNIPTPGVEYPLEKAVPENWFIR